MASKRLCNNRGEMCSAMENWRLIVRKSAYGITAAGRDYLVCWYLGPSHLAEAQKDNH